MLNENGSYAYKLGFYFLNTSKKIFLCERKIAQQRPTDYIV